MNFKVERMLCPPLPVHYLSKDLLYPSEVHALQCISQNEHEHGKKIAAKRNVRGLFFSYFLFPAYRFCQFD